jgi:alpha-ketoglutarate-dependent taurine dioxygenase
MTTTYVNALSYNLAHLARSYQCFAKSFRMRPLFSPICRSSLPTRVYNQSRCRGAHNVAASAVLASGSPVSSDYAQSLTVPHLTAPTIAHSIQQDHVHQVHEQLWQHGILKISLGFPDPNSHYLGQLVLSLHQRCGHQLPISHSASRGWFWDVRPESVSFQTANHRARSETMEEFPWHTDCSYEEVPPRFFALQVLQHDRFGGGTLSAMNIQRLNQALSPPSQASLMRPEYRIKIPKEFVKDPAKQHIVGNLMAVDSESQYCMMRFRRDIITPLTESAAKALGELDAFLQDAGAAAESKSPSAVHLTAAEFPMGTIIMMDNRRWLHARDNIKDPERHLRRLRWDAIPFPSNGMVKRVE